MKRIFILTIIPAVLISVGIGYAIGYFFYIPKLVEFAKRVDALSAEVSNLMQTNSSLLQTVSSNEALITTQGTEIADLKSESTKQQTQITTQQEQVATQQEQIATLETERKGLQTDLNNAEAEIEYLEDDLLSKKQELFDTKQQLGDVLDTEVTQYYQWEYDRGTWYWDLPISIREYRGFAERPRPSSTSQWVDMATDPMDDYYIDQMVDRLTEAASEERYSDIQTLNYVISFVQSMPYTVDDETTPYDEYPRYPLETLFDRGGDCEDTSILVAALLDEMGYDVVFLMLENAGHVAVGVSLPSAYGTYYVYGGRKYYYLETTGDGWGIGEIPPDIEDATAYIYPLRG